MTDWFVLYTQSRAEPKVSKSLTDDGLETYWPSRLAERRQWRTREIHETRLSLFPRYVFVRGAPMPWFHVAQTAGVQGSLNVNGVPSTVSVQAVEAIKQAESIGIFDERVPTSPRLHYGQKVRFMEGGFAGRKAIVQRMMSKKTVKVATRVMGGERYVTVPVDALLILA